MGMDAHLSGVTRWKFGVLHQTSCVENDDPLTRRVLAYKAEDGSGAAVINLVNADVLPSFLPDDEITAQVVGFPVLIHYYENEEKYAEGQTDMYEGKKLLLADGGVFPAGLLSQKEDKSHEEISLMQIRGTVKSAQGGLVQFGEDKGCNFIDIVINTEFGDLEIVHSREQVDESEYDLIKEGSVVNGIFAVSGDVAIGEYKEGYILDFDHNLSHLRYTLQAGEAERMRTVLSDDAIYYSEWTNDTYKGKDAIIDRFNYVHNANNDNRPFFAHFATITEVEAGEDYVTHGVGDRCIVIAMKTEDNLESICFMDCDESNKICRIEVTRNPRYHFVLDEKKLHKAWVNNTVSWLDDNDTAEVDSEE
jgi:hypothetical protein